MTYSPETYQRNKEAKKRLANQKKYDDEHHEHIRERRKNTLALANPETDQK
jgi:hypothetical protein